jgi:hypothetical protein
MVWTGFLRKILGSTDRVINLRDSIKGCEFMD